MREDKQIADFSALQNKPAPQLPNALPYPKEQIQAGLFSPNAKIQSMSKIMQAENDKYARQNEYGTSVSYDENNQGFVMDKNGNPKFIGVSKASDKNSVNSVPSGYMVDPEDPNALVYKKGGPADPELKAHTPIGNRESVFINRVATSANETAKDLANIVRQPLTVDRGLFGGRVQAGSLFSAGAETLTNKMTSQDVQSYNVLASGIQRNLASIEAAGLSPSGSLTHQMDAMTFKDGDTNFTKLQKLAQIKQIAQAGLETTLSNPRLPKEQVAHFKDIIAQIDKAVPFNNGDLLDLQSQQQVNPEITINDILKSKQENAQPKASVKFNAPPDPSKYVGKTIRDDATGILLKSNGKTWLQVK